MTKSNKTDTSSSTSTSTSTSLVKTSSYSGGSYFSTNMKPTFAFKALGVEFWGVAKFNLDEIDLDQNDLIVNCSGLLYTVKPFVTRIPSWMNLSSGIEETPEQLLLEWRDMGAPPSIINLDFWKSIINQAIEHGIKRIICCCGAGQGRTGTALASFLLAVEATDDPELAISYIRKTYSSKSIETKSQENYIYDLIYPEAGEVFGKVSDPYQGYDDVDWDEWSSGSSWQEK